MSEKHGRSAVLFEDDDFAGAANGFVQCFWPAAAVRGSRRASRLATGRLG